MIMMKFKKTFSGLMLAAIALASGTVMAQKPVRVATVGFMNVENLWDTIKSADYIDGTLDVKNPAFHRSVPLDSLKHLAVTEEKYIGTWNDESLRGKKIVRIQGGADEFTPKSAKNYTYAVYQKKLENSAKVISEMGAQYTKMPPVVAGLIEVENRRVVEDLIKQPSLSRFDYGIVHYNSYDYRGIDVALIYQKRRFTPSTSYKREVVIYNENGNREYTRDILVTIGYLDGERFAFFMNHWPSRRGGEAASEAKRNAAGKILREEIEKIQKQDPTTKIVAMGDFNDDPTNTSITTYLGAAESFKQVSAKQPLVDLMTPLYKKGVASLAYQDAPNLFDQIIVSPNLVESPLGKNYTVYKAEIFAPSYLITKEGSFKGYPSRSWAGDTFTGGYSDHFPAFVVLQKEAN